MRLINGRAIATALGGEIQTAATALRAAGAPPALAVVVPTRDEATAWYVRTITRTAAKVGIECQVHQLDEPTGAEVARRLDVLSADPAVHGIVCQTPLPSGVSLGEVGAHIDPAKDVDGANPLSLGRLTAGLAAFAPATAMAVLEILRREAIPFPGRRAVVIGRSIIVGKPVALLLLAANTTVTICHSHTVDLASISAAADILVVAIGRPHAIGIDHIRRGAVVIDVGTNPTPDGLTGDVDAGALADLDVALTPVPGGVGPVTTMLLLRNTVDAAGRQGS
ncbi:MAG TPA: bifunctional 5,10-methylenetetrahydrofolate dehydrogenase/5,10-methenyltetrahydrofolate cyclohydrolase [Pseudonocardiaceae bacterium]